MIVDDRFYAWLGLGGTLCDAVGGLYLAYDLLGGRHGPLGILTRAATYGLIFSLAYGLALGPWFGVVAGAGLGCVLASEFWRVARHQRLYGSSPLYHLPWFGAARGIVLGAAAIKPFGWEFGLVFAFFNTAGLALLYGLRYAPTNDYRPQNRPRWDRHVFHAALLRGLAVGTSGALAGWIEKRRDISIGFGFLIGVTASAVSIVVATFAPMIEDRIENLPELKLALFGFGLIFAGLCLQCAQYLAVILR